MNIESLANYADVVGGVAVVISLIYVGIQIHRNTKSSLSLTNQSAHESLANVSLEAAKDPNFSALTRRGMLSFEQLNEDEQFQFLLLMVTVYRRFENIYYQYRKGFLEAELWEGYEQSMLLYFYMAGRHSGNNVGMYILEFFKLFWNRPHRTMSGLACE